MKSNACGKRPRDSVLSFFTSKKPIKDRGKMRPENKIVRGMWIGERLTNIQKLCIRSFQDHGHEFHLYVPIDIPVAGIPEGTVVHQIAEVAPLGSRNHFANDANFSDWFRVNMIYQLGGWYVDMD